MIDEQVARTWLETAMAEAQTGLAEGGIPIGAALFTRDGVLLGSGHNKRVQDDNPAIHGETDAFINAGRQTDYRQTVMVTTLSPCLYCTGLIRQFNIGAVVVGENTTFEGGGIAELQANGIEVLKLDDQRCIDMMTTFIEEHPALWNEDIGMAD